MPRTPRINGPTWGWGAALGAAVDDANLGHACTLRNGCHVVPHFVDVRAVVSDRVAGGGPLAVSFATNAMKATAATHQATRATSAMRATVPHTLEGWPCASTVVVARSAAEVPSSGTDHASAASAGGRRAARRRHRLTPAARVENVNALSTSVGRRLVAAMSSA